QPSDEPDAELQLVPPPCNEVPLQPGARLKAVERNEGVPLDRVPAQLTRDRVELPVPQRSESCMLPRADRVRALCPAVVFSDRPCGRRDRERQRSGQHEDERKHEAAPEAAAGAEEGLPRHLDRHRQKPELPGELGVQLAGGRSALAQTWSTKPEEGEAD